MKGEILPLSKICSNQSRRFTPPNGKKVWFVNTGDVLDGNFLHRKISLWDTLPGQAKKSIKENDVLYSEIRPGNGRFAFVRKEDAHAVVSTKFMVLEANRHVYPRYLYHLLTSKKIQREMKQIAESRSGTFPQITFDSIEHLEVYLPEKKDQIIISKILDFFSNKIELNKRTNETLERIANALFKSWFVDFDPVAAKAERRSTELPNEISDLFADSFEDSELGEIPKGWNIQNLEGVIDEYIDNRGKTPPIQSFEIPLVEVKHLASNLFPNLKTEKYVSHETFRTWFRKYVQKYDLLISTVGTIGLTSIVFNSQFAIAQNVLGLRFCNKILSLYMFYLIKNTYFQYQINARLVETVQKSIKRKDLNQIPIILPDVEVLEEFAKIIVPVLERQYCINTENQTLELLRDTLLPKLISGELRVPDDEKMLEEIGI